MEVRAGISFPMPALLAGGIHVLRRRCRHHPHDGRSHDRWGMVADRVWIWAEEEGIMDRGEAGAGEQDSNGYRDETQGNLLPSYLSSIA